MGGSTVTVIIPLLLPLLLPVEKVQEQEGSGFNVEDATTIGNAAAAAATKITRWSVHHILHHQPVTTEDPGNDTKTSQ